MQCHSFISHKPSLKQSKYQVYTAKTENRYCEVTDDCMPVTIYLGKDDLVTFIIYIYPEKIDIVIDIKCTLTNALFS